MTINDSDGYEMCRGHTWNQVNVRELSHNDSMA